MRPDSIEAQDTLLTVAKLRDKPHVAEHLADGTLIVVPESGSLLTLNSSGALVYREVMKGRSSESIAHLLVERFHVSRDEALADVAGFLSQELSVSLPDPSDIADNSPFRFVEQGAAFAVTRGETVCLDLDREGRHVTIWSAVPTADARDALLWVTTKLAVLQGTPVLHASAVRFESGGAIAFAGRSGAGKTTLARACASHGATLLCEDSCALLLSTVSEKVALIPFEETARGWTDDVMEAVIPGKPLRVPSLGPRGDAPSVPLENILLVDRLRRRGDEFARRRVHEAEAAAAVMLNLFWAALDFKTCSRAADWAGSVARRVPVHELTAPAGTEKLVRAIADLCLG